MDNFTRLLKYIQRTAHIHAADPAGWAARVMAGQRIIAALPKDIQFGRLRADNFRLLRFRPKKGKQHDAT